MKLILFLFLVLFSVGTLKAQNTTNEKKLHNPADSVKIDKINISKNWISWDLIVKKELLFAEGEWVRYGQIDTSIQNIWNIGNFANVNYTINETEEGNVLELITQDAVVLYPLITIDHSSENDYYYEFGYGDGNFLGSNSKLKIMWNKMPGGSSWDFSLKIPRQLLYKNMTALFGYNNGHDIKRFVERIITDTDGQKNAEYKDLMLAPYDKMEIYTTIGNPWHLDYKYRFSPDFSIRYMRHEINYDLLSQEELDMGVEVPLSKYEIFNIGISESIGIINIQRHRKNGYLITGSYNLNLGLNGTKTFHEINLMGEYHKTLNNFVQLSTWFRTGYSTADDQYRFIKGSSDVLGLRLGEIYGKAFYSAYLGSHFTWINKNWLSIENAYFINWGNGYDEYLNLFTTKQKAAIGTSFDFRIPAAPILAFRLTFMYAGPGTEWFKFNM